MLKTRSEGKRWYAVPAVIVPVCSVPHGDRSSAPLTGGAPLWLPVVRTGGWGSLKRARIISVIKTVLLFTSHLLGCHGLSALFWGPIKCERITSVFVVRRIRNRMLRNRNLQTKPRPLHYWGGGCVGLGFTFLCSGDDTCPPWWGFIRSHFRVSSVHVQKLQNTKKVIKFYLLFSCLQITAVLVLNVSHGSQNCCFRIKSVFS